MESYITACALKFRWIDGQCFEIKLPNGKVIVTDPFYPSLSDPDFQEDSMGYMKLAALDCPFSINDFDRVDYIIVNHTHFDHILHLQELVERFHPQVIIHSSMAIELAENMNIPLSLIYPVDFQSAYYFDGFSLETLHGLHHPVKGNMMQEMNRFPGWEKAGISRHLSAVGGLLNMNWILTTPENISIGFFGGDIDGDFQAFEKHRPTILFRNKLHATGTDYDVAKDWADYLDRTGIPLMVPMHHEKWFVMKPGYTEKLCEEMNHYLEEKGSVSRVLCPERTKWYSLGISIY